MNKTAISPITAAKLKYIGLPGVLGLTGATAMLAPALGIPWALAAAAGYGGAGHIGTNLLVKALRSSKKFTGWAARKGIEHGLAGKEWSPHIMDLAQVAASPEVAAEYQLAWKIGKALQNVPIAQRERLLGEVKQLTEATKYIKEAPMAKPIAQALGQLRPRHLRQPATSVIDRLLTVRAKPMTMKAVGKGALKTLGTELAAEQAISPLVAAGAAPHLAMNLGKIWFTMSEPGKRIMTQELAKGFLKGGPTSKTLKHLTEAAVTPSYYAPAELGAAIRKEFQEQPAAAQKLYGKLVNIMTIGKPLPQRILGKVLQHAPVTESTAKIIAEQYLKNPQMVEGLAKFYGGEIPAAVGRRGAHMAREYVRQAKFIKMPRPSKEQVGMTLAGPGIYGLSKLKEQLTQ